MSTSGLAARVAYAAGALAAVGAAGFYSSMWLLPKLVSGSDDDGYETFLLSLGIGLALGFSAGLLGLTLPWIRRRRRSGRAQRMAISSAIVVIVSVGFASQEHQLIVDLLIAAWLAYTLAFTYVRYGVLDSPRVRASMQTSHDPEGGDIL